VGSNPTLSAYQSSVQQNHSLRPGKPFALGESIFSPVLRLWKTMPFGQVDFSPGYMNVENTEEATIKQAGVVHGSDRICDYLPLVAFWRVVGRFD
jgi:hypothetical protein